MNIYTITISLSTSMLISISTSSLYIQYMLEPLSLWTLTGRTRPMVGRQLFELCIVGPLYPSEVINGKGFFR